MKRKEEELTVEKMNQIFKERVTKKEIDRALELRKSTIERSTEKIMKQRKEELER